MTQNVYKFLCRKILQFLLIAVLLIAFAAISFGQTPDEEARNVAIPEELRKQIINEVLISSFKPRDEMTVVYLYKNEIKKSWLPKIKNIEFRLRNDNEIKEKDLKVHFFTEINRSKDIYDFGFAFGTPFCNYTADHWYFRISQDGLKLWIDGNFGGICWATLPIIDYIKPI